MSAALARRRGVLLLLGSTVLACAAAGPVAAARPVRLAAHAVPPAGARPLVPPAAADALARRAGLAGRRAPDLRRWVLVPSATTPAVPPPPSGGAPCRRVGAAEGFPAVPASAGPPAPDLTPLQDLRTDLALAGLGPGGDGAGVRVGSVEFDWDPAHVELDGRVPARPAYRRAGGAGDVSHGTAALALIGARDDGEGVTGIAPAATLHPVSPLRGPAADDFSPPAAIAAAAAALGPGDVLLVELQSEALGPVDTGTYGAAVADAVRAATAAGVVVVIPAGNAGDDLAGFGTPVDGALVVGGGESAAAGGVTGARASMSNTGARIDVQGPALGVVTATAAPSYYDYLVGGPDTGHRAYTHCFNGTSSAAAAIAGGVAAMQGIARAGRGAPFTPAEVRARLLATAVPQPDAADGRVGPRPQFRPAADLAPPDAPSNLLPAGAVPAGTVVLRWTSPPDAAERASGRGDDVVLVDGAEVARVAPGVGEARVVFAQGGHRWSVRALDRVGNAAQADASLAVGPPASLGGLGTPGTVRTARAGAVTAAGWLPGRRTLVLRVRLARGARLAAAGRMRPVRRGLVRLPARPGRRLTVVLRGPDLRPVTYRVTLPARGRPRVSPGR